MSRLLLLLLHDHTAFPGCTPASVCVCGWVCTRCWGSRVEALMRSIVIQGAFTQATPAGSPGTSPLKWRPPSLSIPPSPTPVLWSHSAGQGNRAVWEEVERKQQRGIRARSRSDQKKWKQGIINWERGQWEFYTKIRFTLEQTSWHLVRARYLRKKKQFCFINDSLYSAESEYEVVLLNADWNFHSKWWQSRQAGLKRCPPSLTKVKVECQASGASSSSLYSLTAVAAGVVKW